METTVFLFLSVSENPPIDVKSKYAGCFDTIAFGDHSATDRRRIETISISLWAW
jgi:hypothetical protein